MVGRSEPCHRCVTHSRNQEDTEGHEGLRNCVQEDTEAIARAITLQRKILLIDEVTSALDPELVGEVLQVLAHLARTTDCTMLFVTHEMRFARESSNRAVMFDHGRIVESGPPERIFTAHESPRTQAFLKAVLQH